MASDKRKEFLNVGILGGDAGVPERRGFRPINTEYIGSPHYDARFFETFPTAWASAYAFQKALAAEKHTEQGTVTAEDDAAIMATTEEWMALFLLHYWGRVQLVDYAKVELEENYDKDLWLALSGTYPSARAGGLTAVYLLETNEGTVVGAYYPDVIFFPSRNRTDWPADKVLSSYLVGPRLSWERCRKDLLSNDKKTGEFHAHLLRIAQLLPSKTFKERVEKFCQSHFTDDVQLSGRLDPDPMKWDDIPGNKPPSEKELLEKYPLRKANRDGGYTYFLVTGMPYRSPWMTSAVLSGCSPIDYRRTGELEITVQVGKRQVPCKLTDKKDNIVMLKDLFLADAPYWCKVSRANDQYTAKLVSLHKIDLRDPVLRQEEFAVCLAPIKREFLTHFPQVFENVKGVSAIPDLQRPIVEWVFPILGHEVRWQASPMIQLDMPKTSLALWPPKVSRKWRFYVGRGRGSKEDCGRWHLVDENGSEGNNIELDAEEYVSILQRPGTSNRPKALLFTDNNDHERGILFLSELDEQNVDADERAKATLSVDFGTSNTCIAYKRGKSAILTFKLSPDMLWGKAPELEVPGFVPFQWGGKKGFFPTVLLARRSDPRLEELKPEDDIPPEYLFEVDIPGLHYDMEDKLVAGEFNRKWEPHANMKWELRTQTPWRALFLHLALLYAHAEIFFNGAQGAEISRYVFTYPLAFTEFDQAGFHTEAKKAIKRIRQLCYGTDPASDRIDYIGNIDESTAIARAIRATATTNRMEVFIDVGGGTADIAIRSGADFLVLDSIKVAGNTFFRFAKKNFQEEMVGAPEFKKHLARLLRGLQDTELSIPEEHLDLGTYYSLSINRLSEDEFRKREGIVIQQRMWPQAGKDSGRSYQWYRARLFFRHILAYALLQACAASVNGQRVPEHGIKLILGGNGWGLMMFAGFERKKSELLKEAKLILQLLKQHLLSAPTEEKHPLPPSEQTSHRDFISSVTEKEPPLPLSHKSIGQESANSLPAEERRFIEPLEVSDVELLNESDLSGAKTAVALGALNLDAGGQSDKEQARPFAGITIGGLHINQSEPITVRWFERWGFNEFVKKIGPMDQIQNARLDVPTGLRGPLAPVLKVFSCLGNASKTEIDNMPEETWRDINAEICQGVISIKGDKVEGAPINHFVSSVLYPEDERRDYIDILAEVNGNYKANGK